MYHSSLHHFGVCGGLVALEGQSWGGFEVAFLGGGLGQTGQTSAELGGNGEIN